MVGVEPEEEGMGGRCPQAPQLVEGPRQIGIGLLAEREGTVVPGANAKLRGQRLGPGLPHAA